MKSKQQLAITALILLRYFAIGERINEWATERSSQISKETNKQIWPH